MKTDEDEVNDERTYLNTLALASRWGSPSDDRAWSDYPANAPRPTCSW